MKQLFIPVMMLLSGMLHAAGVQRIACIGASITEGATLADPAREAYPAQLQNLLGSQYKVFNYGVSSTTLLRHGNYPYRQTTAYQAALAGRPDIVFIDLGGNDAKFINRKWYNELEKDGNQLIESFRQLPSHPRIIVMLPFVSFETDTTQIWDKVIVGDIIPGLQQSAYHEHAELLDMHSLLINRPELFSDKIHPDKEGARIIAERLYQLVKQDADTSFDVFSRIKQPFTTTNFKGFHCSEFTLNGRNCKIVKPAMVAPGRPWVWRARFWGHEPQADIALLEHGFHVVYCDAAEWLGNQQAISLWDDFYDLLQEGGLSKKAVLEGMSRGGVYVFNWAAAHPTRVAAVYVDNPLLNMQSWAKLALKTDSTNEMLQAFFNDYAVRDSVQLNNFNQSPVDKVKQIVKGHYPILIVCADADEAVSPADNTLVFEQKVNALHGHITVIHKPGFKHHPHSLPNPKPIVDFILEATGYHINVAVNGQQY